MKHLLIAIIAILSTTAHAGEQRQPDNLSLITALVAATGQAENKLHIFDYDCTSGRHIGWLECRIEYTQLGVDELKTINDLGVKAQ